MADLIPPEMQLEMAACRKHLRFFIEKAFGIVTPGTVFSRNWHVDLLGEYLSACYRREIKRLIINVPPRSLKSVSVSVAFPAWAMGHDPSLKFMCASYSEKLSFDLSMDTRRVMTDPWYKLCFPNTIIAEDQNEKSKFSTTQQGYRIATSVGGRATGMGGNCFPAGTMISTDKGRIPIERLVENKDEYKVVCCDIENKKTHLSSIRAVSSRTVRHCDMQTLRFANGSILKTTNDHLIYTGNRGYAKATSINLNDHVFIYTKRSTLRTNKNRLIGRSHYKSGLMMYNETVYDIQVEKFPNFFAEGVLAHNCLIVDDCHTPEEAMSDTIRDGHLRWFDNTWTSRLNNKNDDVMIVVGQRLHRLDLPGHLMAQGGWEHLVLPAIFESHKTFSMGGITKTVKPGELLHADRFSKAFLDNEKRKSSFGYSGQYMQNPVPEGGGIVKYDWFELWPAKQKLPRFHFVLQVWDTAFTEKTSGDPSACCTFGVFYPEEEVKDSIRQMGGGFAVMLIDCFQDHLGFPDLRAKMVEMRSYRYGEQEKAVDMILVEDKASGQSILQELHNAGLPMKAFKPGRMDKTARLHSVTHFIENGMVYIPESTITPGKFRDWASDFVDQICSFPAAEHDDYVDCASSALITLSNMTFLRLDEMAEDVEEHDGSDPYATAGRPNPYGS